MTATAVRPVRAPATVIAVRIVASLQALAFLGLAAGGVAIAVASGRRSGRHHSGNSWSDLGVGTGVVLMIVGVVAALLVAVPAWRLRPGRPSVRSALMIIECVIGVVVLLLGAVAVVYVVVPVLSCLAVALLLRGATTRAWVDGEPLPTG